MTSRLGQPPHGIIHIDRRGCAPLLAGSMARRVTPQMSSAWSAALRERKIAACPPE
jgi:hypothetical protein